MFLNSTLQIVEEMPPGHGNSAKVIGISWLCQHSLDLPGDSHCSMHSGAQGF